MSYQDDDDINAVSFLATDGNDTGMLAKAILRLAEMMDELDERLRAIEGPPAK